MKAGRLSSSDITQPLRYYSPLRLLVSSVSDFGCPYTEPLQQISRDKTRSPALPSEASLTSRPDDPGKSVCFSSVSSADGVSLPHLTTGSALSFKSYEALWVPWWYGLRVCDPFSVKVFLIRLVLRVASQNRIFASGVNR